MITFKCVVGGDAPLSVSSASNSKVQYVWDPERNLGLGPSQIHQDHAAQCQEECHDGLELEWDHGKFQAVGDYCCHTSLGKPDSTECGLPSHPNVTTSSPRYRKWGLGSQTWPSC